MDIPIRLLALFSTVPDILLVGRLPMEFMVFGSGDVRHTESFQRKHRFLATIAPGFSPSNPRIGRAMNPITGFIVALDVQDQDCAIQF